MFQLPCGYHCIVQSHLPDMQCSVAVHVLCSSSVSVGSGCCLFSLCCIREFFFFLK
jgi:hypothetical protein